MAAVLTLVFVPAGAALAEGHFRLVVVLATWGPTPMEPADVRRAVLDEVDAFYRASSGGRDVRTLRASAFTAAIRLRRGAHRVGVAALDRAGNHGATASVRVVVR